MKFRLIQYGDKDVGHVDDVTVLLETEKIALIHIDLHTKRKEIEASTGVDGEENSYACFIGDEELQVLEIPVEDFIVIESQTSKYSIWITFASPSLYDHPRQIHKPPIIKRESLIPDTGIKDDEKVEPVGDEPCQL